MKTSAVRLICAAILAVASAVPAPAYIHFPPMALPKICKDSQCIRMMKVTKVDKEKGVVLFELERMLKGEELTTKKSSLKQVVPVGDKGTRAILEQLAEGKQAVLFTIEGRGAIACGYVFIDEFCYSVDYNYRGEFWRAIRVDPQMAACYHGSAADLAKLVPDVLAGKDVKVPVKELPRPITQQDKDERFKEVNDVIIENRK